MIKIHFINVGHGDCIVIEFKDTGRTAVIDINVSSEMDADSYSEVLNESFDLMDALDKAFHQISGYSDKQIFEKAGYNIKLTNTISYIQGLKTNSVFRFISTHPHMDHLSGLNELKGTLGITNFWIIKNEFSPDIGELSDSQKEDWNLYKKYRNTFEHKLDEITVVRPEEGDSNLYWNEDKITILSPNPTLVKLAKEKNNSNIMSYVLLVEYGNRKIILGGDAEEDTWKYIHENYKDKIKGVSILKASHHGRDNGFYEPAVEVMKPVCTIVSVGKKPKTDASNKYKKHSTNVWSTRWKGNIGFEIESDGKWTYWTEYDR